ncbi:sensor histidine kinase [Nonomuraea sp. MG754425]|uniref:sensor histidine kinase n=1 Tax=Nonomuraea sp. MG754425 TaxID=2570319 RepID=UPI001F030EFB|nr:histidine kinase [Nonomuraea sp. MG754425]
MWPALAEQRLRISREVHDVVAHTLAVVGVHLNVAVVALDDSPEEARAALRTAIAVRNQATRDLKAFVGELRDTPQQGLESVADLVAQARAAGLEVHYEPEGDLDAIPAAQALTAYRVVQEASSTRCATPTPAASRSGSRPRTGNWSCRWPTTGARRRTSPWDTA